MIFIALITRELRLASSELASLEPLFFDLVICNYEALGLDLT
jgi:hypothetical protein